MSKAYGILMTFELALSSHFLASEADMSVATTMIIFHVSGVVGCETLLWILIPEFLWWYMINVLLLLVASFCFFNCIGKISQLLHGTRLVAAGEGSNSEAQEAQV
ncbi:putative transmembrane protein [Sesbania bispinosa]|nr:putative transmembrane protein [Sesbania bispinosa]